MNPKSSSMTLEHVHADVREKTHCRVILRESIHGHVHGRRDVDAIDNLMKAQDEVAEAPKHLVREAADTERLSTECDVKEENSKIVLWN